MIVVGSGGQVGRALLRACPSAVALGRADLDLSGNFSLFSTTPPPAANAPTVVVNVAAYTAVDAAEDPNNRQEVYAVNAQAPGRLAEQCRHAGVPFIHVSTDYVFGGQLPVGQVNPVDGRTEPVNEYGRSKLAGEEAVLAHGGHVVRTSWVYSGPGEPGRDFVTTMLSLAQRGINPTVVDDQYGRPSSAPMLASGLLELSELLAAGAAGARGEVEAMPRVLHLAGGGDVTTWYGFAREIFARSGHDPRRVSPVPSSGYLTAAPRPGNTALDLGAWRQAGLTPPPAWQESLGAVLG